MEKRAIIYARVSGNDMADGKDGRNLAGQLDECREKAMERGYTIVAELAEDARGASGADWDLPEISRVRAMAENDEFDVFICREMDRLGRNTVNACVTRDLLLNAGIMIDMVLADYPDDEDGQYKFEMDAAYATRERVKITKRLKRGRRNKVKKGYVITHGRSPYGFTLYAEDESRPKNVKLKINEKEAEVIRLIFNWYVQGISIRQIQRELTQMEVPTPADRYEETYTKKRKFGEWGRSTIYTILHNEAYAGTWWYGKPNTRTAKSKRRLVVSEPPVSVTVPAIITPDVWEAAQRITDNNRDAGGGNCKNDYLMRGHAICGICQSNLNVESSTPRDKHYSYYCCRVELVGQKHRKVYFPTQLVDDISWEWIKSLLLDPQAIADGLTEYRQGQETSAEPIAEHISLIDGILIDKKARLERLLDLYLSGELNKDLLVGRKSELETLIKELEQERASLKASLQAQVITREAEETILSFASKIAEGLHKADENYATRRAIIDALDASAILTETDGQKTLQIRCILGEGYYVLSPVQLISQDAIRIHAYA